jgi:hypothetical protein
MEQFLFHKPDIRSSSCFVSFTRRPAAVYSERIGLARIFFQFGLPTGAGDDKTWKPWRQTGRLEAACHLVQQPPRTRGGGAFVRTHCHCLILPRYSRSCTLRSHRATTGRVEQGDNVFRPQPRLPFRHAGIQKAPLRRQA